MEYLASSVGHLNVLSLVFWEAEILGSNMLRSVWFALSHCVALGLLTVCDNVLVRNRNLRHLGTVLCCGLSC